MTFRTCCVYVWLVVVACFAVVANAASSGRTSRTETQSHEDWYRQRQQVLQQQHEAHHSLIREHRRRQQQQQKLDGPKWNNQQPHHPHHRQILQRTNECSDGVTRGYDNWGDLLIDVLVVCCFTFDHCAQANDRSIILSCEFFGHHRQFPCARNAIDIDQVVRDTILGQGFDRA